MKNAATPEGASKIEKRKGSLYKEKGSAVKGLASQELSEQDKATAFMF